MYLPSPDGVSTSYVKQANVISRARLHAKRLLSVPVHSCRLCWNCDSAIELTVPGGFFCWTRARLTRASLQPPRIHERPAIACWGLCGEIGFCKEREKGLSLAQSLLGCGRTVIRP